MVVVFTYYTFNSLIMNKYSNAGQDIVMLTASMSHAGYQSSGHSQRKKRPGALYIKKIVQLMFDSGNQEKKRFGR
jgi:hypothetical protein